ncbi:insulinase family protein, partial [bacterium]|nr:insulinase family protein [bacterium]
MNQHNHTKISTLPNGLRICAVSFPRIKTVSIHCYIFVGSIHETRQNNGISHFVEHMLFRGNEKLGNTKTLNLKIEELGGEINASTSFEMTEYWLDFHRDYLDSGIHRFCGFLQHPSFEQIEIERSIILEEILDDYNQKDQLIDLDGLISNQLWPEHPMGLSVIGNLETVRNISREDLVAWYQQYYQPQNMVVGITGDFEVDKVLNMIADEFKHSSTSKIKKHLPILPFSQELTQIKLVHDSDNQFAIQWAFPQYGLDADLRIQYQLIRRILDNGYSSRLQRLIREEKGLVYDISAEMLYFENGAVLFIQSLVGINQFSELIEALTGLINEMGEDGITQDELDRAKLRYKIDQDCERDTAHGVLYSTLWPIIYPTIYPFEKSMTMVNNMSLEKINQTVKNMLAQNKTCFVLVGPWTKQIENL